MMNEVEFVVRSENFSQTVKSIPLRDMMSQLDGVGVSVVWVDSNIERVREDLFGKG